MEKEKWWDHPGDVFAVIVGSILVSAAAIWGFERWEENQRWEAAAALFKSNMEQLNETLPVMQTHQVKMPTTKTVYVPGRSVEECNLATGNMINETWTKCRSGGTVTITQ